MVKLGSSSPLARHKTRSRRGAFQDAVSLCDLAAEDERGIVAACLLNHSLVSRFRDQVAIEDLGDGANRELLSTMITLEDQGAPWDELSLLAELRKRAVLAEPELALSYILDGAVATAPERSAERIQLAALRRRGAKIAEQAELSMQDLAQSPVETLRWVHDQTERLLSEAGNRSSQADPIGEPAEALLDILQEVVGFVRRFVILSQVQVRVVALWVVHTFVVGAADTSPYLAISSAEKRCGKTRLLEVLELLVNRPWLTSRVSAAVLVRKVEAESPTLLLDESDAAFGGADREYTEALRGILNCGHRRGGCTSLCVGKGTAIKYRDFSVFGPKAISGIGRLPDTVQDRSIPIRLKRKSSGESVERFRRKLAEPGARRIRNRVAEWATAHLDELKEARPPLPAILSDRQQDGSEPLLAIADAIGGQWPESGRTALIELFAGTLSDDSLGVRLIDDIRDIFQTKMADKLASTELIAELVQIESSPWAEFNRGKAITPITLARLLKPFDIGPRTIRTAGGTPKGYLKESFEDAWTRYLRAPEAPAVPEVASETQHQQQGSIYAAPERCFEPPHEPDVAGAKSAESAANIRGVAHVAGQDPDSELRGSKRRVTGNYERPATNSAD